MLKSLKFAKYRLILRVIEEVRLPEYPGSAFRGGFGHALRRVSCAMKDGECPTCLLVNSCVYAYVFETPLPPNTEVLSKSSHVPHPFVIDPHADGQRTYARGETFDLYLVLIGRAIEYLPYFIVAFEELGRMGIGKERGRYRLEEVLSLGPEEEVLVYSGRERRFYSSGIVIIPDALINKNKGKVEQVEVEFVTPTRLKYLERLTSQVEFHLLLRTLLRRISSLIYFHCGERLNLDFKGTIEAAKAVFVEKNDLEWWDWERYSARQGERMKLGGVVGRIAYRGPLTPFIPYLLLGEYIHVGKGTSFGLGQMRLHWSESL